jgi:hypothetical protein
MVCDLDFSNVYFLMHNITINFIHKKTLVIMSCLASMICIYRLYHNFGHILMSIGYLKAYGFRYCSFFNNQYLILFYFLFLIKYLKLHLNH